eukprot:1507035-Pyramimonas_sp.AAC.1
MRHVQPQSGRQGRRALEDHGLAVVVALGHENADNLCDVVKRCSRWRPGSRRQRLGCNLQRGRLSGALHHGVLAVGHCVGGQPVAWDIVGPLLVDAGVRLV